MKTIKYLLAITSIFLVLSCKDHFLDRYPMDALSDKGFFTQTSALKNYMNGMYSYILRDNESNRWIMEDGSDNVAADAPVSKLTRQSASSVAPVTDANWTKAYAYIRQANYYIANAYSVPSSSDAKHYIGEGYFCRAWAYFYLLQNYGAVPYIEKALNINDMELYRARDPRNIVAQKILQDLDSAIQNLNWKGVGAALAERINKEAALTFKTRVGLFEGSWEYYHGLKATPYKVSGNNGADFLNAAITAGDQLIAYQGTKIFKGSAGHEYEEFYNQLDYTNITGAFLFKAYSLAFNVTNNWARYSILGYNDGLTKSCIDAYLMNDGRPAEISTKILDDTKLDALVRDKDPRLGQTIFNPAKGCFGDYFSGGSKARYPGLIAAQEGQPCFTGYRYWKGNIYDPSEQGLNQGQHDDLIIHYEEALLNYAEAKAILGSITQADLDKTINLLRNRVNMVPMKLADVNSWSLSYSKQTGYDPGASNIVNEIRRERRVELVLEGFRYDDLRRWALLEDVFNGWKPVGAHLKQFLDYWNNGKLLLAGGYVEKDTNVVKLYVGTNVNVIGNYVNSFFKNADFNATTGRGYFIDPGRDYLSPIPSGEIILYKDKGGVKLEQNPGWF